LTEDFTAQLAGFRPGSQLAGYRLEAQVGKGGMAVVFRARDERLGRLVALKILVPWLTEDEAFRRRFVAESRAAAAVDDPYIIPVYEAGEAGGVLFIAMRFVHGGDLGQVLSREGVLTPGRAAGFVFPVASALDAAHAAGLVHRDVKPANILVDTRPGWPEHVYLSDFGISKGAASSSGLTIAGRWLGTLPYVAPEQIMGRAVDGRADQYALACLAFQLLTGTMPFERDEDIAVVYAHTTEPPPSLSARRPGLPAAADEVIAKAMAKVPEQRYGSCREFAAALREALGLSPHHAAGDPSDTVPDKEDGPRASAVHDPLPTPPDRGGQGTADQEGVQAREPDTSPVNQDAGPTQVRTIDRPAPPDQGAGQDVDQNRIRPIRPRRRRVVALAGLAAAVLAAAGIAGAILSKSPGSDVGSTPPSGPAPSSGSRPHPVATIATHSGNANTVAFSPNGAMLAIGTSNGNTDLWNAATGKQIAILTDPASNPEVTSVAFSPAGMLLAVGDVNGSVYLWDTSSKNLIATLTEPGSSKNTEVDSIAFNPDGTAIAAGNFLNGATYVWNSSSRKLIATLTDPGSNPQVNAVAFSPSGTMLATGDFFGSTYIWNSSSGKLIATLTDPSSVAQVNSVAFSPSGTMLATGDTDGSTYVWNVSTRKVIATLADPGGQGVEAVAFSPTGKTLAAADRNGNCYLWNIP
jgi:serine/threonine protein kinase